MNSSSSIPISSKFEGHFNFLDALRGLAALWVFLRHLSTSHVIDRVLDLFPNWSLRAFCEAGEYGVAIFFVLSGFVMAHSLRNIEVGLKSFSNFSLRRFIRLTPPYYFSIVIALIYSLIISRLGWEKFILSQDTYGFQRLSSHLVYLQDLLGLKAIEPVYWTLCLEIQFYLGFYLLLSLARSLELRSVPDAKLLVFIPTALFSVLYAAGKTGFPFFYAFFPAWFFSFLLGVFAYWSWRGTVAASLFYSYLGLSIALAPMNPGIAIVSSATALMLFLAGQFEKMALWLNHDYLRFLGKISYSFYLTHPIAIGIGMSSYHLMLGWTTAIAETIATLWTTIIALAIAWAVWWLTERPAIAWSRSLKR